MKLSITDNAQAFIEQKIQKNIALDDSDDSSIFNVLMLEDLEQFQKALKFYSANRLISFRDAIDSVLGILIEEGGGAKESELYDEFYSPYYLKLQACEDELDQRQHDIEVLDGISDSDGNETVNGIRQDITEIIDQIHVRLDFEQYLGDELFKIFSGYRREDVYSNSNYISDGLDNSGIVKKAGEFLALARKDIYKSGNYQHSISSSLYNLLAMEAFSPLAANFDLGNWIRVRADDQIYRLRLISYEIDFENPENLSVAFSDVTKSASGMNDINSILNAASSLASSYGHIEAQAANGSDAQMTLEKMRAEGLSSALYQIKNADTEEITFDKTGLLARSYNDIEDVYEDNQLKLTHNILAFTADNWRTVTTALGLMSYQLDGRQYTDYGLNANYVIAGKVIAGDIYSANYTSEGGGYLDITDGMNSVIIDPHNLTEKNYIFLVKNKNGTVVGIDTLGNAIFNGQIGAAGLSVLANGSVTGGIYNDSGKLKIGAVDNNYYTLLTGDIHCDKAFYTPWCILGGNNCGVTTYGWQDWFNEDNVQTGAIYSESTNRNKVGLWVEARNGGNLKLHTLGTPKATDSNGDVTEWNDDAGVIEVLDTAVFRSNLNVSRDMSMPQISMGYDMDTAASSDHIKNYFSYIDFHYNSHESTSEYDENMGQTVHKTTVRSMNSGHIFSQYNNLHIATDASASGKLYLTSNNGICIEGYVNDGLNLGKTGHGWLDLYKNDVVQGRIYAEDDGIGIKSDSNIHMYGDIQYLGDLSKSSSRKYKKNIKGITSEQSDKISKLNPVEFDYIENGRHSYGLIAEEAAEVMPEVVSFREGAPDSINYVDLVPFLIKKVQDLEKEIDYLKHKKGLIK